MIATAFAPDAETARVADARWVAQTADRIVSVMEDSRPTWQMWHVRAEAERQIRTINLPPSRRTPWSSSSWTRCSTTGR